MIVLPSDTTCELKQYSNKWIVSMVGPFGYATCTLPGSARIETTGPLVRSSDAYTEQRLQKLAIGVCVGFKRYLRIRGVGYHLKPVESNSITIVAGFSYDLECPLHPSITIKATRKFSMIKTQSRFLATVTDNLALLRHSRKADIYRGLGIYYRYEKILYKPGSKQKSK